ncbi:MAG: hypothetical protein LBS74_10020 [Oscillospiraceae bacterium]|jgi:chitinase|nr:hypothetical protein [Oscillospiraceae bacterium]
MKRMRKIVSLLLVLALCAAFAAAPAGLQAGARTSAGLPTNIIIGYWHNGFNNGSTNTKLRNVNVNWDIVNVSFMMTAGDRCTALFEPDYQDVGTGYNVYPGTLEQRIAEFKSDVAIVQARGQHVNISIGGATGVLLLTSDAAYNTFWQTSTAIIDEYGFDGIDIDLEGASITLGAGDNTTHAVSTQQKNLAKLCHAYVDRYGSDFIITMAPEHNYVQQAAIAASGAGSITGAYLPLVNEVRDVLTCLHPQYYNNGIGYDSYYVGDLACSGFNANSYINLSKMLIRGFDTVSLGHFDGLRPDQVAIGVPAGPGAAGSGVASISQYQQALQSLMQEYPTFRGIMTWSTNWDEKQGNAFVNGIRQTINQYGHNSLTVGSITSSASGQIDAGQSVTWTASASNATGAVQYKFDLYKNTILAQAGSFGSSASFTKIIDSAGEFYVKVTVKDSTGEATKNSAAITAVVGVLNITQLSSSQSGLVSKGTPIVYSASAVGGLGTLSYAFDVYNGTQKVVTGSFGSSTSYTYTPTAVGYYSAELRVKDTLGTEKVLKTARVLVTAPLSAVRVNAGKSTAAINEQVSFTLETAEGVGGNSYQYYLIKGGKIYDSKSVAAGASNSVSFKAAEAGSYQVRAYAKDGDNTQVLAYTTLTVA